MAWKDRTIIMVGFFMVLGWTGCTGCGNSGGNDAGDAGSDSNDGDGEGRFDDDAADCRFDPSVPWDRLGEILQMEDEEKTTCVWLLREDLCPEGSICKVNPFNLLEIRIGHQGQLVEISDESKLSWSASWHNWEDVGEVKTETTTYQLEGVSMGNAYDLSANNGESFGPIHLLPYRP